MKRLLTITALGDREVVMSRLFNAPRQPVFDAWTQPELLQQWLGVRGGWTMPHCQVDLKVGGQYRYVWRNASGTEMGVQGVFREVVIPQRIVCTERFDEPWYPGESLITHVLEEKGDQTLSTVTMRYESTQARGAVLDSPMESGVADSYDKLDNFLGVGFERS